jgi:hypothetical protein
MPVVWMSNEAAATSLESYGVYGGNNKRRRTGRMVSLRASVLERDSEGSTCTGTAAARYVGEAKGGGQRAKGGGQRDELGWTSVLAEGLQAEGGSK